jgi:hypothetical protein
MKKTIDALITIFVLILWVASLPITVLAIIWIMANQNAEVFEKYWKKL